VAIWGTSGHALVVADIMRCTGHEVVGFLDDLRPERHGTEFCGSTVLGGWSVLDRLRDEAVDALVIAVGANRARAELSARVRETGFRLAAVTHPRATVAQDVHIGSGTIICAGAVISPAARIGEDVIVNTAASVDHECRVANGAHVGPGARLGGCVTVGRGAWIGIGATIRHEIVIGEGAVVGAGAVVVRDVPPGVVVFGVPARVVRSVSP